MNPVRNSAPMDIGVREGVNRFLRLITREELYVQYV
jgi:hypothetical protein